MSNDAADILRQLPPHVFIDILKMCFWAQEGVEKFGLELAYMDDELITFRRKVPFSVAEKAKGE